MQYGHIWYKGSFIGLVVAEITVLISESCKNDCNKITFKRTRSLPNAACYKHDSNVCACAVSASILLPVENLSLQNGFSDIDSYTTWNVSPFDAAFRLIMATFQCTCAVSTVLLLPVYNLTSYLNSPHPFSYKDAVISGARHHFWRLSWR